MSDRRPLTAEDKVLAALAAAPDEARVEMSVGQLRGIVASRPDTGELARLREALTAEPQIEVTQEPEDGSWSVRLRGLPGHIGAGDTLEQAVAAALDAAEAWALAAQHTEEEA